MTNQQQQQREDCRREVRRYLVERQKLAFTAQTVTHRLEMENSFTLEQVIEALVFLVGAGQVKMKPDPLGATEYFQATSDGVLAHERRAA